MKKTAEKIRVASLFSGCGGGDLGLLGDFGFLGQHYEKLGYEIVWANDMLPFAVETYKKNISGHIVEGDIAKIKSDDIPDHDLLVGGFPCQSFSIVGERKGFNDPRGLLYLEMIRVLKDKKPKAFIAENVKGLVSAHKGTALTKILNDFDKVGYLTTYKVLNASHFGVPQKRERVFIIGIQKDIKGDFNFPDPTWNIVPIGRILEDHGKVDQKYYFSHRALLGLAKANKAFNKGRVQQLDAPCNTISTHLAKVSLNGTDPVLLTARNKYRRLTPVEAARIQSFPDGFEFAGPDGKKYIQIGNAIPPVLMWHIANALKKQVFDGRPLLKKETERDNVENPVQEHFFGEESIFVPA